MATLLVNSELNLLLLQAQEKIMMELTNQQKFTMQKETSGTL